MTCSSRPEVAYALPSLRNIGRQTLHASVNCRWCGAEMDITIEVQKAPHLIVMTGNGTEMGPVLCYPT